MEGNKIVRPITFKIVDDFDKVISENNNQFTAVRKIQWGDSDKTYLDIRKWWVTPEGTDKVGKGISFGNEDDVNSLTKVLVEANYGKTVDILNAIKGRDDFKKSINIALGKESELYDESIPDDYYDPTALDLN